MGIEANFYSGCCFLLEANLFNCIFFLLRNVLSGIMVFSLRGFLYNYRDKNGYQIYVSCRRILKVIFFFE